MKKLNLGCGENWKEKYPDYEGLDIIDFGQKYVGNVLKLLDEFVVTNKWFTEVMANHFLEHFDQNELKIIFSKVHDILETGGLFKFVVPHKDKGEAWVLSHKTYWCEETIKWLEREDTDPVYGFGRWKIDRIVVNKRKDIHVWLRKI